MNQNHSIFGRYMATTYFYEPPFARSPDNILATTLGGRDNLAQSLAIGDTMVLSNTMVNNIRFAFNRTAIHRTHIDFFGLEDVGVNMLQLPAEHYMLLTVTGGFSLGGGTENDAIFQTEQLLVQRRPDDDPWAITSSASARTWRSGIRSRSANVRSPGTFTFDGGVTGLGAGRLHARPAVHVHPVGAEHARHAAEVLRPLRPGHLEAVARDDAELRGAVGALVPAAASPNGAIYNFSIDRFNAGTAQHGVPAARRRASSTPATRASSTARRACTRTG